MAANAPTKLELVDPEGDLILEVGDPNATSSQGTGSKLEEQEEEPEADEQIENGEEQATDEDSTNTDKCSYVRILVCSKVLIWTSSVFRQMLNGPFAEAQQIPDAQGRRTVRLPDDDPTSMLEICNILHHHAGSSNINYPYEQLDGLAVLCDKYDFKSALFAFFGEELSFRLPGSNLEISSGLPPKSRRRSLEIMRMAYLVGNDHTFRNAALIYAYVQHPDRVASDLQEVFNDISVPDGLLPQIYALQAHLLKKYGSIPTEILENISSNLISGSTENSPTATRGAILAGSGWTLCDGVLKQLGVVAAFLADQRLFSEMHKGSVEQYAMRLKKAFFSTDGSPGAGCYCKKVACPSCRGIPRPDMTSLAQRKFEDAFVTFWDGRVCLKCVQENRPLRTFEVECSIH